jgi:outer membrane protein assembly factor BamD
MGRPAPARSRLILLRYLPNRVCIDRRRAGSCMCNPCYNPPEGFGLKGGAMRLWPALPRLGAGALLITLVACGGGAKKDVYIEKPVDELYNKAMDEIVDERYAVAAKTFDQVESQHPYSVWATKGQLMGAYAQYEAGNYDQAILAADRFIQLHPGYRDVAYAYYLKGISYYIQITDVGRDQKITEQALRALDEVVRRFPDTKYARDAKLKLDFTRDHLAGKEMEIGRYYQKHSEYLAAMNRFKRVVDNYQTTTHVPEALERIVECDLALGLTAEAKENAAVLGYNYPGSHWYTDAYALVTGRGGPGAAPGWFGRTFGALF